MLGGVGKEMPQKQFPSRHLHTLRTHNGPVNAVTFSSYPGTYVLTGSSDRAIHLSRAIPTNAEGSATPLETTKPIQRYEAHGYSVLDIAVAADNARFASVGGDRQVFLWDVEQGGTTRRWTGHNSKVEAVQFAGDGDSVVVSGSADTTINLWDTRSNAHKPIQTLTEATDTVSSLHVHMPSYSIASGSYDGHARVYDVRMGKTTVDVLAHPVTSVRCSSDGNALLISTLDSYIRLLDRADGKLLAAFGGTTQKEEQPRPGQPISAPSYAYRNTELRVRSVFAQSDAVILSGSEAQPKGDGMPRGAAVFAWDVLSGETIATVPMGDNVKAVSCVAWNTTGYWAAGGADVIILTETQVLSEFLDDAAIEVVGNQYDLNTDLSTTEASVMLVKSTLWSLFELLQHANTAGQPQSIGEDSTKDDPRLLNIEGSANRAKDFSLR
ncbi:hypothetical protein PDE_09455 [Penicillium oxalicum 114-2]|uniref:Uncharacterized protein n=1 Tax=Penicillium oxalicum (strain 114-2 / CGMCC 5302) TaxID=933388 RepID=S8A065_PENO1|nr:hypothetical protein PDE_09455 [Penicillium oxalicum 114-2]